MRPSRSLHSLLFPIAIFSFHAPAMAGVGVSLSFSVGVPPPPLPVYAQPACPDDGYIWTPGYWAYGPDGWFWVPGTWVLAPEPGYLWTPGYWAWSDGVYLFHAGYWGPEVGFYGGINYGCGYGGSGYEGGYWRGDRFYYNRTVNNVNNVRLTNVYTRAVSAAPATRVSYNGGAGGIAARPTLRERQAESQRHLEPTSAQVRHLDAAGQDRRFLAAVNHGRPPVAGTARPADFQRGVPARGAANRTAPPERRGGEPRQTFRDAPMEPRERPFREAPEARPRPPQEQNFRPAPPLERQPRPQMERPQPQRRQPERNERER